MRFVVTEKTIVREHHSPRKGRDRKKVTKNGALTFLNPILDSFTHGTLFYQGKVILPQSTLVAANLNIHTLTNQTKY